MKANETMTLRDDAFKLVDGLNKLSIAMNSNFEGATDEVSKLLHKVRKIMVVIYSFIGDNFIDVFDFDKGYCDEIMSATPAKMITRDESLKIIDDLEKGGVYNAEKREEYKKNVDKLSINYQNPLYQTNITFPVRIDRVLRPNEFQKSVRTEEERAQIMLLRDVMSWVNQYNMKINAVQTKAKDFLIKLPLIIAKYAEEFVPQTAYTVKNLNNENTGKLRYFKDGSGNVYSLLYNISEDEKNNYETIEDLLSDEKGRKAVKLTNIHKFTKPGVGNTEEEKARATATFIQEVKEFERDFLKENYNEDGITLRGIPANLVNLRFLFADVSVELSMYYKDVRNPGFATVPLFSENYDVRIMKNVVSKNAIKEDEAAGENKLGLNKVCGCMYANGGSIGTNTISLLNDKTDTFFSGEGIKTKEIDKTLMPIIYEYQDMDFRPVVNGFLPLIIFMWKD